ncbi:MAG TPA: hypothetical protein DCP31_03085, partial [Cyanobacteria bacterium UBA8543]|nr:hypothetical protein [Cyanobacteria bacterium UBA8543]
GGAEVLPVGGAEVVVGTEVAGVGGSALVGVGGSALVEVGGEEADKFKALISSGAIAVARRRSLLCLVDLELNPSVGKNKLARAAVPTNPSIVMRDNQAQ